MTDEKKQPAIASQPLAQSLKDRVEEIQVLESQIISLKKGLLIDEAVTEGEALNELNFLVVEVNERLFAAPIKYIDEVVDMPALEDLPSPMPTIVGLVNYHGYPTAVIDLAELLGTHSETPNPDQSIVICNVNDRRFAIKVDKAIEVKSASTNDITLAEQVLPGIFKSVGILMLEESTSAMIIDIAWIAMGAQLANLLSQDAVTPAKNTEE